MYRTTQERLRDEHASRVFDYGKEFRLKVTMDYECYVFLSPKTEIAIDELVQNVRTYQGYDGYRLVRKQEHIVHFYLRFKCADYAKTAIEKFREGWAALLNVASVSEMLEAMYSIESHQRSLPLWTATVVDVVGRVDHSHPLDKQTLESVLRRFGEPRIFDMQWEGGRVKNVQALFSSMAEALGAAIVLGHWADTRDPIAAFYYRIRIVGGQKEESIFTQLRIRNAKTVFAMEYFVGGENASYVQPSPQVYLGDGPTENVHHQIEYPANCPQAQRGGGSHQRPRRGNYNRQRSNNYQSRQFSGRGNRPFNQAPPPVHHQQPALTVHHLQPVQQQQALTVHHQQPAVHQQPALPVHHQQPAVQQQQALPVHHQQPAVQQQQALPVHHQQPAVQQQQALPVHHHQQPAVQQQQALPVHHQQPAVQQLPVHHQQPAVQQLPVHHQQPAVHQQPALPVQKQARSVQQQQARPVQQQPAQPVHQKKARPVQQQPETIVHVPTS